MDKKTIEALGEGLRELLGLDDMEDRLNRRLDRIERRVESMNISPADLEALEDVRSSLKKTDTTIDSIEPEGDAP